MNENVTIKAFIMYNLYMLIKMILKCCIPPEAGRGAGCEVIRERELPLPATSWNSQESRSCTSPRQHNRANLLAEVWVIQP